jgi:sporulation protein YlmC with PRC-barrel domain
MARPMLSLVLAAIFGATQAAAQEPASAPREELVAVGDYNYDDFYDGFRLSRLINLPVIGADGKLVGKIADITIAFPGELERVVIEPEAAAPPMEGGRFSLRWNQLKVRENFDSARITPSAENLEPTAPGQPIGPVERPGIRVDQWHVSELIGSRLEIDGGVPVGTVDDIVAGGNDVVKAVVFRDTEAGTLRAVPWRSVVVEPGNERLTVPLTKRAVIDLPAFRYQNMADFISD